MSKTESKMIELGTTAPDFILSDTISNTAVRLYDKNSYTATVVMFICNHCPYVKYINEKLVDVAILYLKEGVRFFAINSNDVEHYPADSPEQMKLTAEIHHYPFPYLFDETQEVATAYQAACTPDFFVYNKDMALVYRGQFDDSRPGNAITLTGESLKQALNCILNHEPVPVLQKPSLGCNIKWK